ncbi:MAG: hypothetical protein B6U72_04830 [Candidatus Altiarchaeales archaeon ex4484_2]|nr:MAG: hypothetical protein B6U72_04830 [Candidatus Altiarchaeales archaeon ex4484_2]
MKRYWKLYGVLVFALLVYMVYPFLEGIIYAIFIYYLAKPIKKQLDKKIEQKEITSLFSIIMIVSLIMVPAMASMLYIADTVYKGFPFLLEVADDLLPQEYSTQIDGVLASIKILDTQYLLNLLGSKDIQSIIIGPMKKLTEGLLWFLLISFIGLVVGFYFLMDGKSLIEWAVNNAPKRDKKIIDKYVGNLDCALNRIFVGVFLTMVITTIFALIALTSLNAIAPHELKITAALIIGLSILCGIFNLLPGVGIKIVWVPVAVLFALQAYFVGSLMSSLWFLILFALVMAVIVDFIPDQILRPYICGSGIHTGLVLLSFIFGTAVFGAKGLFLGPIILVSFIEFMKIVVPELNKESN